MRKLLPKFLLFPILLFPFFIKAQVGIGIVNSGPYGRGSTFSVPISIGSATACIDRSNVFELYLSDENGSFANEVKIGENSGFYTTHINGTIPANTTPGNNYRIRVKTTNPVSTTESNGNISVVAESGPTTTVAPSSSSNILSPGVFGWCGSAVGAGKAIILKPDNGSEAQLLALRNVATGVIQTYTLTPAGFSIDNLALGYYTVTVSGTRTSGGQTINSSRTYLLLNVPSKVNIQSGGTDFGCIDPETGAGADISYSVNISGETGIQNNYPGSTYLITWGDGKEDRYTHCELLAKNGLITHNYKKTSCGEPPISLGNGTVIENAFRVSVSTINPFCQQDPVSATTYPKIFSKPVAHIDPATATAACINKQIVFSNTSTRGNNADCSLGMQWKWYVDDVLMSDEEIFVYEGFKTPGIHVVKLVASNDVGICRPSEDIRTICVQNPPEPAFTLNSNSPVCAPFTLKPTNTSVIDANCNAENSYLWTVTGGPVSYLNNTNETSKEPEFSFTSPGVYKISLSVRTASCGEITTPEQTIVINGPPSVQLSPDITICNLGTYDFSDLTSGPTKTAFSGTLEALPDTYTWTVTGGDFAFAQGSDLHSQFPKIEFREYQTYTVTVIHKNNCGTVSGSQQITFRPSPTVDAGSYNSICFNDVVQLKGKITGTVSTAGWIGGTGVFTPGRSALDATYTPSASERAAGKVELILRAETNLAAPCNVIESFAAIALKPENIISGPDAKSICIASAVDYTPTALPGSTFRWEVTNATNVTGYIQTGSGTTISDVLGTSNPDLAGEITYRITPVLDGCDGRPFDLKVTVVPQPRATAAVKDAEICSGSPAGISISGNQAGLRYLWTSSTSATGITGNTQNTAAPASIDRIDDILTNNGSGGGTVTYKIIPVNDTGCTGPETQIVVTIKPAPVISNNTISGDQSVCEGTPVTGLTGTLPSGGGGIYNYQWQSATDGNTWTDIPSATGKDFNPGTLTTTTWYRRVVIVPNCSGSVSFYSNVIKVLVNLNARAEFTYVSDLGCIPFSIDASNITATAYADRNGIYSWYADNVLIGNGINFPGYTINEDNRTVTIKLVVTSSQGCASAEMSHEFGSRQSIAAAFVQDKTEGCGPLSVVFTNKSTSLANTTFEWDFGNGQTSDKVTPGAITFLPDPTGKDKTYTVKLTATSACGTSAPFESTVLVRGAPLSVFSPDRTAGCSPMAVSFSNTSPAASNTTYTFDFGDGSPVLTVNDRQTVNHTYTALTQIRTYTVKMTTNGPCGTHTSEHKINVAPNTVVAELVVNGPDKRGCAPFTVPFFNNSTGADAFEYDFGDGSTAQTIQSPERLEHTFTQPGTYTVVLKATNGCSVSSTSEVITVLPQPSVSFTALRNEDCNCLEVNFTNTSTDGVAYTWDFGDGSSSSETNPTHIYAAVGKYTVRLTAANQNGCVSTAANDIEVTGIPGNLFIPNAFMPTDPNPELRAFSAKGSGIQSWKLSVFDKWGQLMWETSELSDGKPVKGWDGTFGGRQMPQGVYFWKADVQFLNGSAWKGMSYGHTPPKRTGIINLIR